MIHTTSIIETELQRLSIGTALLQNATDSQILLSVFI